MREREGGRGSGVCLSVREREDLSVSVCVREGEVFVREEEVCEEERRCV